MVYLSPSPYALIRMTELKSPRPESNQKKRRYDRRLSLNSDAEQCHMAHLEGGGGRRRIWANKRRSSGENSLAISLTTCPIFLNICNWRSSIWLTWRS